MNHSSNPTLRSLFLDQYEPRKLLGASKKTRRQYLMQIDIFGRFLGREATAADLNDDTVCRFLQWIVDNGRRPATANKARAHLLSLWRYFAAPNRRLVDSWPEVPRLPDPERVPKAWSRPNLARLFAAARERPGTIAGIPAGLWWAALHSVLWDTGERIGAIRQIQWSDVDLDEGWLTVRAELRKGRRKAGVYRLHADTVADLRAIAKPKRKLVFPWDRAYTHLWYAYRRLRRDAGLPTSSDYGFHALRRSVASYGDEAGLDATKLLGHSSRKITERYLDPTIVKPPQASEHLFRPGQDDGNAA